MAGGVIDPAFKIVSKNTQCFLIWRVEKMGLNPVPRDQYGTFYMGDSYLILCVVPYGEEASPDMQIKDQKGRLDQRIHFWLGSETSQDEAGVAAIKAVELDDYLGGAPVQYREVEGKETSHFVSYFKQKGGIEYKQGGVSSGFNHVEHIIKPRLLHVKGKQTPRIKEMPSIHWHMMNDGDAYILDVGDALFVWLGNSCSRTEKLKAMKYGRGIRDERGRGDIIVVESGKEDQMLDDEKKLFCDKLPLPERKKLKTAAEGGADDVVERKSAANLKLWKCAEEGETLKVTEIASKPLKRSMLDSGDTFIVDNGEAGIWVWIGKKASKKERSEAMRNAQGFKKQKNYPEHTQVIRVIDGGEPVEFKALFKEWEAAYIPNMNAPRGQNRIAKTVQTKFDASTMHSNPKVASATGMMDDGSGTKQIWRIERDANNKYDAKELDKKHYGSLYGGDSYIILYTYEVSGRQQYILYFWLGRKSTADERGAAALKTVEIDDSLGGAALQVRVLQGKEPNHFLAMFGGKLIIYSGGKAGWGQQSDDALGDVYLLQIRGTSSMSVKAEQVVLTAESLNSNDCFVMFTKTAVFVWAGKGSTGDEREMAKTVASVSPRGYNMVLEGQEKPEFWKLLGGKVPYSSSPRLQECKPEVPPRLFQCSNASGQFTVDEIPDFVQEDLVVDDVFILDAGDCLFVWIGKEARPEEKTMAMDTAGEYMNTDPSGRDPDTPIFRLQQGCEPPNFIGFFGAWDRSLWSDGKSYADLVRELGEKNIGIKQVKQKFHSSNGEESFSEVAKYPASVLRSNDNLPEGVDPKYKEKYLSDEEFKSIFGMTYANFVTVAPWKQQRLKKEHDLF